MTGVVNLRRARKDAARRKAEAAAHENRHRHGRVKAERELERSTFVLADRVLDGHRMTPGDDS